MKNRMLNLLTTLLICFLLVWHFWSYDSCQAESKIVEVDGSSVFSKEDAIKQAQRTAVESAVGVFVQSETEIENYQLKKDRILSRTQGYVTRFDILKQWEAESIFHCKIKATVSLDKIKDDLLAMKILLSSMDRPKIVIIIEEEYTAIDKIAVKMGEQENKPDDIANISVKQYGMSDLQMRLAETELTSILTSKGFDIVDQAQLNRIQDQDMARQALAGNIDAVKSLGLDYGAQYMILGKTIVQDAGEVVAGTGLRSLQASLQIRIIMTRTGLILGSVVKTGVAAHISPLNGTTQAIKKAVKQAVDDYIIDTITNSFQDYLNNGAPIKVNITGVSNFKAYKFLSKSLEGTDRVVSCKKDGWNKAGGLLVLDIRFKGSSEELAEILDEMNSGDNVLEVVDFSGDRVDCQLKSK